MEHTIKPLARGMKLCGPAFTVKAQAGDNVMILRAIRDAQPGDVIVVDCGRCVESGPFGELTATECKTKGLGGFVTTGSVRDSAAIIEMGFPVFSSGISIVGTVKESLGLINHPISAGAVIVRPGDLILGDDDGIVVVPQERLEEVLKKSERADLKEVNRDKDLIYVAMLTLKSETEGALEVLRQSGFMESKFKGLHGKPDECEKFLEKSIEKLDVGISKAEKDIAAKYGYREGIECLHDQLVIERDREKARENLLNTDRTFGLEGWIPEVCIKKAVRVLTKYGCWFEFNDPVEGEEPPVVLKNRSMAYPFESITEMYSLPAYGTVDPTGIMAPFYAVFFGMMLSDAGYGIILTLATYIILKKFNLEGMTYRMMKMFFYCGISTVFWGAMFGGWFGDFVTVASRTFLGKEITIDPVWFNPLDDPITLLIFSIALGIVHLFIGMGIQASELIKSGHKWDAVFDIFSWYMVIIGLIMWMGGSQVSQALVKPGMYVTIAGAAILLLTGGRKKKGIGKITGGLGALYNVTSYASDILSYSRLLALGLATGVIAQVVNTVGTLGGGGVKGAIIMVLAFFIGHTFNLAINALGAFVHTSRLQYIEFFGKFYEDGGEEFTPLRRNTKYIKLSDDTDGGVRK